MTAKLKGLRILSLEDEPETIEGSLSYLELSGHAVTRVESIERAEEELRGRAFDLVIVDQRLPRGDRPDYEGGSSLILELKGGGLGELNQSAAFVFVTASQAWIQEDEVSALDGYMGIEVKGGDLSRHLEEKIVRLRDRGQANEPPEARS